MKKFVFALFLASAGVASAQTNWVPSPTAPSGSCPQNSSPVYVVGPTGAGQLWTCQNITNGTGTWTQTGSASGTVTSVTGTANQIDVATGTTTPALSLDPALILPTGTTLVAPVLGTPASGVITNLTGTCTACTANAATSATNLAGGLLGSTPYQSAANTTAFVASPTTSGHTFVYSWAPSGSAIAPTALDLATYLASPPAIGGSAPAAISATSVAATGIVSAGSEISSTRGDGNAYYVTASTTGVHFLCNSGAANCLSYSTNTKSLTVPGSVVITGATQAAVLISTNTKFTATGCTSISATAGGAAAGKFTIGASSCTVVITINGATGLTVSNGYSCHANDETTAAGNTGLYFSANSTTTATLTVPATAAASDVIDFGCEAF